MKGFFFDYIYFRLQNFYKKWDGDNGITAVIGVSMIQAITFFDVFLIILRSFYSRSETQGHSKTFAYIGVTILIALILYNYFRFKDRFKELESKW